MLQVIAQVEAAETAKAQGNKNFKEGDYSAAAAKYEQGAQSTAKALESTALSGGDKTAVVDLKEACHLNLANCRLKLGEWDAAVAECTTVLERGENRKARFRRGDGARAPSVLMLPRVRHTLVYPCCRRAFAAAPPRRRRPHTHRRLRPPR